MVWRSSYHHAEFNGAVTLLSSEGRKIMFDFLFV